MSSEKSIEFSRVFQNPAQHPPFSGLNLGRITGASNLIGEVDEEFLNYFEQTGTPATFVRYGIGGIGEFVPTKSGIDANIQLSIQLIASVQQLKEEIQILRDELANRTLVSSITIAHLSNNSLSVLIPIPVILEETADETLARWPEVNAYGLGATMAEAIHNLKENIADIFTDLTSRDPSTLGKIAINTLEILNTYIQKRL